MSSKLNLDDSNPRLIEFPTNSKQNLFPLDFPDIFTVILAPITRNLDNSNQFLLPFKYFSM